jgi:hypothetical protein
MRSLFHCAILTIKLQGITIGDCGLKWDLTALIMVQLVSKTLKENMLDRFSSVNEKGNLKAQYQVIINGFSPCWEVELGFLDRHWLQPNLG